jgi:hypothetical protein
MVIMSWTHGCEQIGMWIQGKNRCNGGNWSMRSRAVIDPFFLLESFQNEIVQWIQFSVRTNMRMSDCHVAREEIALSFRGGSRSGCE